MIAPPAARRFGRRTLPWAVCAGAAAAGWFTGLRLVAPGPADLDRADRQAKVWAEEEVVTLTARTNAAWDRIEAQLESKAPRSFAALPGPADPALLVHLEEWTGRPLPPDVRASWLRHDGSGGVLSFQALYTAEEIGLRLDWWDRHHWWALTDWGLSAAPPGAVGGLGRGSAGRPAAVLPLGTSSGRAVGGMMRTDAPGSELVVDLRDGTTLGEHISGDNANGANVAFGLPPAGSQMFVGRLEVVADLIERLPADAAAFRYGRFDQSFGRLP